jgi:hypothetical protein
MHYFGPKSAMKFISAAFLLCCLYSCSSNFYEYKSTYPVKVYDNPKGPGSISFTLPAGESVIVKKTPAGPYRQARYKDYYGWVYVDSLQAGKRSNSKSFGNPEDGFVWDTSLSPTGTAGTATKPASGKGPGGKQGANGHSYNRGSGGMHHRQQ